MDVFWRNEIEVLCIFKLYFAQYYLKSSTQISYDYLFIFEILRDLFILWPDSNELSQNN